MTRRAAGDDSAAIRDQAVAFHLRLKRPVDASERRALDVWLAADPRHREAYDEVRDVVGRVDRAATELMSQPATMSPEMRALLADTRMPPAARPSNDVSAPGSPPDRLRAAQPPRLPIGRWQALVASLLVAVLMLVVLQVFPAYDYRTGTGERRAVELADGSTVTLNADSVLDLHFDPRQRLIQMGPGEAFFQVAPDRQRPFVVEVDGFRVEAVGTAFNIRHRDGGFSVTVTEGRAAVSAAGRDAPLLVDQAAGVESRGGELARVDYSPMELSAIQAWQSGRMVFIEATLAEMVREMNHHTPGRIVILDRELQSLVGGGVFETGDPEAMLLALKRTLPIDVIRLGPYLTLLRERG